MRKRGGHFESPGRKHELKLLWTYSSYCNFSSSYLCLPSLFSMEHWFHNNFACMVRSSVCAHIDHKSIKSRIQKNISETSNSNIKAGEGRRGSSTTGSIIFLEKKGKSCRGRTGLDWTFWKWMGMAYMCGWLCIHFIAFSDHE